MSNPEIYSTIFAYTSVGVGIILAAAALGSALGWGLICSKYLEGIARQPEMKPTLMTQMLLTGGLMEAFPMIALGVAMWFATANPFIGAMQSMIDAAAKAAGAGH